MDNSTNHTEQIIRYLDNEMSTEEKTQFESVLSSHAELQQELNSLHMAKEAIHSFGLHQHVSQLHEQMMHEMKQAPVRSISPGRKRIRYTLSIAATIIVLVIGYAAYNFFNLSAEKLYAEQYSPFEISSTRGETNQTILEKLYADKNYSGVISEKNNAAELNSEELLIIGVSYLELNQPENAIENLRVAIGHAKSLGETKFQEQGEYYLALAYLKNKNYNEAIGLMQSIHDDPNHLYQSRFSSSYIRKIKMLRW
jgi:tetratricopeptide (TPR) repeat protein